MNTKGLLKVVQNEVTNLKEVSVKLLAEKNDSNYRIIASIISNGIIVENCEIDDIKYNIFRKSDVKRRLDAIARSLTTSFKNVNVDWSTVK